MAEKRARTREREREREGRGRPRACPSSASERPPNAKGGSGGAKAQKQRKIWAVVVAETPCMCSLYLHLHNPRQDIYSVPWVIIRTSTGTRSNRDLDLEYCLRERMTRLNNVHCTAVHLSFRVPSASELQLFFRSGSGYFKDKDKLLSLSLPPCRSYLFSLEHIQSFPPSLPICFLGETFQRQERSTPLTPRLPKRLGRQREESQVILARNFCNARDVCRAYVASDEPRQTGVIVLTL